MKGSIFRSDLSGAGSRLNFDAEAGSKPVTIVCKVDGLCEPAFEGGPQNPGGVATYGYFISFQDGRPITKGSGVIGEGEGMDHMVAEYESVVQALRYLLHENRTLEPVEICNDNQEVGKGPYTSTYDEARKLSSAFSKIDYKLINRESIWEADCLAWKEYRQYLSKGRTPI